MKNLQSKNILIIDAQTNVNSVSKKSRMTGQEFLMGKIIFERNDGMFFDNVTIKGELFRPFFRFASSKLELSPVGNNKKSLITINTLKIK